MDAMNTYPKQLSECTDAQVSKELLRNEVTVFGGRRMYNGRQRSTELLMCSESRDEQSFTLNNTIIHK